MHWLHSSGVPTQKLILNVRPIVVISSEQVTNVGLDNVSISSSLMAHLLISLTTQVSDDSMALVSPSFSEPLC